MASSRNVTELLGDWSRGNQSALNELLPLVYAELRRIAARQLRRRGSRTYYASQNKAMQRRAKRLSKWPTI